MTLEDKKTFPCDFGEVKWSEYQDVYIFKGITATLLGDRSDKKQLKRNADKWKLIHYSFLVFCALFAVSLLYMIVKMFFL